MNDDRHDVILDARLPRPAQGERGVTWYGTLGLLAATLGLLATAFFGG